MVKKANSRVNEANKKRRLENFMEHPSSMRKILTTFLGETGECPMRKKSGKKLKETREYRVESVKIRKTKANKHS